MDSTTCSDDMQALSSAAAVINSLGDRISRKAVLKSSAGNDERTAFHYIPTVRLEEGENKLFKRAIQEVEVISGAATRQMRHQGLNPDYLFDVMFFLCAPMFQVIASNFASDYYSATNQPLDDSLVRRIFTTRLLIASYSCSADEYFSDSTTPRRFAHFSWGCERHQYYALMNILDNVQVHDDMEGYCKANEVVQEVLQSATEKVRKLFADCELIEYTIVLDDHMFSASGANVSTNGYSQDNNEKKAKKRGITMEVMALSFTRLAVGVGVPQGQGRSRPETIRGMLSALKKSGKWDDLSRFTILMDRDYGFVRPIAEEFNMYYISTAKKGYHANPSNPFTFGDVRLSQRLRDWMHVVPDTGGLLLLGCEVHEHALGARPVFALAYRPKSGTIVLFRTNMASLMDSWTISATRYQLAISSCGDGVISDDNSCDDDDEESNQEDGDYDSSVEGEDAGEDPLTPSVATLPNASANGWASNAHIVHSQIAVLPEVESGASEGNVASLFQQHAKRSKKTARSLTLNQRGRAWFVLRTGACSSTAVDQAMSVFARQESLGRFMGSRLESNVCGEIDDVRDVSTGIKKESTKLSTMLQSVAMKTRFDSCATSEERHEVLRDHCSEARSYFQRSCTIFNKRVEVPAKLKPLSGSPDSIRLLNVGRLKEITKAAGVPGCDSASPSKEALCSAIFQFKDAYEEEKRGEGSLLASLIDTSWNFKPFKATEPIKAGRIMEPRARKKLPSVLRRIGAQLVPNPFVFASEVKEYGLLESVSCPYAVTSVDGLLLASGVPNPVQLSEVTAYIWENKAVSGRDALTECKALSAQWGMYTSVAFDWGDSDGVLGQKLQLFGSRKHEVLQLLHHSAVVDLPDLLYTVVDAVGGAFLRVIRVSFCAEFRRRHRESIQFVFAHHIPFTFEGQLPEELPTSKAQVGATEFRIVMEMRRALRDAAPIGAHKEVIPLIAYTWNKGKSGVDMQSKDVQSLSVRTAHHGTHRKVILEAVSISLLSALRLYRVMQVAREPNLREAYKTRDHLSRALADVGSTKALLFSAHVAEDARRGAMNQVPTALPTIAQAAQHAQCDPHFDIGDPSLQLRVEEKVRNVQSSSLSKAKAFKEDALLNSLRLQHVPHSWCTHEVVKLESRTSCIMCCMGCADLWPAIDAELPSNLEGPERMVQGAALLKTKHAKTEQSGRRALSLSTDAALAACHSAGWSERSFGAPRFPVSGFFTTRKTCQQPTPLRAHASTTQKRTGCAPDHLLSTIPPVCCPEWPPLRIQRGSVVQQAAQMRINTRALA